MRNIVYYDSALTTPAEGEDKARMEISELKSQAKRATTAGAGAILLRDANQWRGELEVAENRYPDRVFLLSGGGNATLFDKIRKAYEEVGVEVSEGDPDEAFRPEAQEIADGDDDLAGLKAEATALGVPFNSATNADDLKAKVDQTRVEMAATASLQAGRGDGLAVNDTVNRNNARVGAGDANARAGNLDNANMALESEDGTRLTNDAGAESSEYPGEDGDGDDDFDSLTEGEQGERLDALKAEADELDVAYAPSIGYATLKQRVDAAKADKE